ELVVVPPAEARRDVGFDVVEVGDRVRRERLELDAEMVVHAEPGDGIHERRAGVVDAVEHVVADAEPGTPLRADAELGTVVGRTPHHAGQDDMRVDVDHRDSSGDVRWYTW